MYVFYGVDRSKMQANIPVWDSSPVPKVYNEFKLKFRLLTYANRSFESLASVKLEVGGKDVFCHLLDMQTIAAACRSDLKRTDRSCLLFIFSLLSLKKGSRFIKSSFWLCVCVSRNLRTFPFRASNHVTKLSSLSAGVMLLEAIITSHSVITKWCTSEIVRWEPNERHLI
jgi:hypothetical protein